MDAAAQEKFPEHAKLEKIKDVAQAIGEFLDRSPYVLCEWYDTDEGGVYYPTGRPITQILADYFGIDLNKIEAEKQVLFDTITTP